jgi:hypothetical protein
VIERLQMELARKKQAGVNLAGLTLWFNPKTFAQMMRDIEIAFDPSELISDQRIRFYNGWTIMGVPIKQSDRVTVGAVCVTLGEEVLIEWDLEGATA